MRLMDRRLEEDPEPEGDVDMRGKIIRLANLKNQLRDTQKSAFASGTWKAKNLHWGKYEEFSDKYGVMVEPLTTEKLCLFAEFLSSRLRTHKTIANYVSDVKTFAKSQGIKVEQWDEFLWKMTIKGLENKMQSNKVQKEGLTLEMLFKISENMDLENLEDLGSGQSYWCHTSCYSENQMWSQTKCVN